MNRQLIIASVVLIFLCSLGFIQQAKGDTVYAFRITFKDKFFSPTLADSALYLSPKAFQRRLKHKYVVNETDRPVSKIYIDSTLILTQGFKVKNVSKWFNSCVILTTQKNQSALNGINFIDNVKMVGLYPFGWSSQMKPPKDDLPSKNIYQVKYAPQKNYKDKKMRGGPSYYAASYKQINLTNTDWLHDQGFKGEQMNIAVIDMGFFGFDTLGGLDSMNMNNRVLDRYNYVKDTINIRDFSLAITHGTDALGTMACYAPGFYVGSAPNANYCLYMSEDIFYESPIEEDNWVSAAERADSLGIDVINTSLGYFAFDPPFTSNDYSYSAGSFDGKTTLIARAHNMATAKGIFCVTSQGNSGATPMKYLATPADADSAYAVGMVDSFGKYDYNYSSSYGPSNDGQVKPDGMTVGHQIALLASNGAVGYTNGTSFSSPLLAGGIACLMQALPTQPVWVIRKLIHQSSSRYTTPSDSMGYGIPNFKVAYETGKILSNQDLNLLAQNQLTLFPNPAKERIQYSLENSINPQYEILDFFGKILLNGKGSNIDISSLASGTYYLRVRDGKSLVMESFIKR